MLEDNGFKAYADVQFHQVDSMQVVHHSQYLFYLEQARFEFAKQTLGIDYQGFCDYGFYLPVANIHCRYVCSAVLGDKLCIHLKVEDSDKSNVTFFYKITSEKTGKVILLASTEHIFTNLKHRLMLQKPDIWVKMFERTRNEYPQFIISQMELEKYRRKKIV